MSSFLSRKYLKYRGLMQQSAQPLDRDLFCPGCGYNLRGLKSGGRCPECGRVIDADAVSIDMLSSTKPATRRTIALGLNLGAGCLLAAGLLRVVVVSTGFFPIPGISHEMYQGSMILLGLFWAWAVFLITPDVFDRDGAASRAARRWARWLNLLWVPGFAMLLISPPAGVAGGIPMVKFFSILCRLGGGIGVLLVLSLYIRASWDAGREDVSDRLVNATWGLGIMTPLLSMVVLSLPWMIYVLFFGVILWWGYFMGRAAWALHAMGRHVSWAGTHLAKEGGREERIVETRAELDAEVTEKIRPFRRLPD